MKIQPLLCAFALLLLTACASVTTQVVPLNPARTYPPSQNVEILLTKPNRPHDEIALLETTGALGVSEADLLNNAREKARENVKFGFGPYMEYSDVIRPPTSPNQPSVGDPIEKAIAGRGGVVGTPDDAIEALEKLWDLTGGFGCLLLSGTNWMDFEATRKSYELFMRYVWPRFCGQNRRRVASMDWMKQA